MIKRQNFVENTNFMAQLDSAAKSRIPRAAESCRPYSSVSLLVCFCLFWDRSYFVYCVLFVPSSKCFLFCALLCITDISFAWFVFLCPADNERLQRSQNNWKRRIWRSLWVQEGWHWQNVSDPLFIVYVRKEMHLSLLLHCLETFIISNQWAWWPKGQGVGPVQVQVVVKTLAQVLHA